MNTYEQNLNDNLTYLREQLSSMPHVYQIGEFFAWMEQHGIPEEFQETWESAKRIVESEFKPMVIHTPGQGPIGMDIEEAMERFDWAEAYPIVLDGKVNDVLYVHSDDEEKKGVKFNEALDYYEYIDEDDNADPDDQEQVTSYHYQTEEESLADQAKYNDNWVLIESFDPQTPEVLDFVWVHRDCLNEYEGYITRVIDYTPQYKGYDPEVYASKSGALMNRPDLDVVLVAFESHPYGHFYQSDYIYQWVPTKDAPIILAENRGEIVVE